MRAGEFVLIKRTGDAGNASILASHVGRLGVALRRRREFHFFRWRDGICGWIVRRGPRRTARRRWSMTAHCRCLWATCTFPPWRRTSSATSTPAHATTSRSRTPSWPCAWCTTRPSPSHASEGWIDAVFLLQWRGHGAILWRRSLLGRVCLTRAGFEDHAPIPIGRQTRGDGSLSAAQPVAASRVRFPHTPGVKDT